MDVTLLWFSITILKVYILWDKIVAFIFFFRPSGGTMFNVTKKGSCLVFLNGATVSFCPIQGHRGGNDL